jgi:hypothetical protein
MHAPSGVVRVDKCRNRDLTRQSAARPQKTFA